MEFITPSDAVHGGLGVVQKKDVVILFSKGGKTEELNGVVRGCKAKKAILITVTENPHSSIAMDSDIILKVKVSKEPDDFNMLATSSVIASTAVFDAICITIARVKGYKKEEFAMIHPGGEVGDRLINGKE